MPIVRLLLLATLALDAFPAETVSIVIDAQADPVERTAADELAGLLGRMHPDQHFDVVTARPAAGQAVLLGTVQRPGPAAGLVPAGELARPGSYALHHRQRDGIIVGSDARALIHGVYAALEQQGCVFALSDERIPVKAGAGFDPSAWDSADAPLVSERVLFNWHNFLSGCTGWDLPQWQAWVRAAARMRYSAILVHAYGNNPMTAFTHNRVSRPVGWLSTTVAGRDWGTQHVDDVRRLIGGDAFTTAVFGSQAAQVPDGQRVDAAKGLMRQVFAYAKGFGLDVQFAIDVDTVTANPAAILATLPGPARYHRGELPDPDTPEGQAFVSTMTTTLLADYPQIDQVVAWTRAAGGSPLTGLTPADLPPGWQDELRTAVAAHPGLAEDKHTAPMLALAKIVKAMRRALDGTGHQRVALATGTWYFRHMPAADAFLPPEVALIGLDYDIAFGTPKLTAQYREAATHRRVIPIVWAHHDDFTYTGRSYAPFPRFATQLTASGAAGFGIIHWLNRPMDLYVRSLSDQTWAGTRDRPLEDTCRTMARLMCGPAPAGDGLAAHLGRWITEFPQIGRETSDHFFPKELPQAEAAAIIAKATERLAALERIPTAGLDPQGAGWLEHFRLMERFAIAFHRSQAALGQSQKALKKGALPEARQALAGADPEGAIGLFHDAAVKPGITRGEAAIIISLNLRWLPDFDDQAQLLGLRAQRVRFAPTQHDPLAQGAGRNTFHVDPAGGRWRVLGTKETGLAVQRFATPLEGSVPRQDWGDLGDAAVVCTTLWTWASRSLPAGRYRVRVLAAGSAEALAAVQIALRPADQTAGRTAKDAERAPVVPPSLRLGERTTELTLERSGQIHITAGSPADPLWLAGILIEPLG